MTFSCGEERAGTPPSPSERAEDQVEINEAAGPSEKAENPAVNCSYEDPGLWPDKLTDSDRVNIISVMAERAPFTEKAKDMPKDIEGRAFPNYLLYSKSPNGREKNERDWVTFSKSKEALFCLPCLLFSSELEKRSCSALNSKDGMKITTIRWRKLYDRFPEHERSSAHQHCFWKWKNLQKSVLKGMGVDSQQQKIIQSEIEKNKALLERLLNVTLFLASRNLSFRGNTNRLDEPDNGNFLGLVELLAKYDTILHDHLQTVRENMQQGKKTPAHYLSSDSQNEFIELCGQRVLKTILNERQEAVYYSIIGDATPDISHREQNVLLLRYVHRTDEWEIKERFIEFKDFSKKTGEELAAMLLNSLRDYGIDIADCRGQGYDNGANMAGKIQGVQARILNVNPLATFSPCATHTLNLVGVHAAQACPELDTFFGAINRLYTLFSASPDRWGILQGVLGCSLHRLSDTRWSARIEAVRPVAKHLPGVIKALDTLTNSTSKISSEARSEVWGLSTYFQSFTAILLLSFWVKVLQCIEDRNLILQSSAISLDVQAANIQALAEEIASMRNSWQSFLSEATVVANAMGIEPKLEIRQRKRKRHFDESEDEMGVESPEIMFRNRIFYVALDCIISQLNTRFTTTKKISDEFSVLWNFRNMTKECISASCSKLSAKYKSDVTDSLESQIHHMKSIFSATFEKNLGPLELLNAIYDMELQSIYGDLCVLLRIFLSLPVTVSGGERAFSKLKLIKNYLRSTMCQERLNSLAMLSIESQLAQKLDFKDIIHDFATKKVRRMAFGQST